MRIDRSTPPELAYPLSRRCRLGFSEEKVNNLEEGCLCRFLPSVVVVLERAAAVDLLWSPLPLEDLDVRDRVVVELDEVFSFSTIRRLSSRT